MRLLKTGLGGKYDIVSLAPWRQSYYIDLVFLEIVHLSDYS